MQLAVIWHWYLPSCIDNQLFFLMYLKKIVSVHSFLILLFNLVMINQTEWLTIPVCPSLVCYFNRGSTEVTNSEKV